MQGFRRRYKKLFYIGLCAVLICVSYAATYYMPDYLGIEGWYSLLTNVSISYIAALIFFILQVFIPEQEEMKNSQVIMNPLFLDLVEFIEEIIACCRKYIKTDESGKITGQSLFLWDVIA